MRGVLSESTRNERKKAQRRRETPTQRQARLAKTRKYKRAWYAAKVTVEVQKRREARRQAKVVEVGPLGGIRVRVVNQDWLTTDGLVPCPDCGQVWTDGEGRNGWGRCPACAKLRREVNALHAWALRYIRGCADCGVVLPVPPSGMNLRKRCEPCQAIRYTRLSREWRLKKEYGITLAEYETLLEAQGGVCAICGNPPNGRVLSVDHDHKTGLRRGLLCHGCNMGLGSLGDSTPTLQAAIAYLQKYAPESF